MDAAGDPQHPPPRHQPTDLPRTEPARAEARAAHAVPPRRGAHGGGVLAGGRAGDPEDSRHLVRRPVRELHPGHALTYDTTDLAFAPYGDRWRQLRKICVLEMLTAARVQSFRRIREEEAARLMQSLAASAGAGAAVDLTRGISKLVNDAFVRECVGSRCKHQDEYLDAFRPSNRLTTGLAVPDMFPSSRIMQMLGTAPRKALACLERIERVLEQVIREKKEVMDRGEKAAHESLLGVLLRLQKEGNTPVPLTDDTIVTLMIDLFAAGSDTSSITLNWAMTELVRTPAAMAEAQAEVREAFKGKSRITEDDMARAKLGYLKMVIREALRLHPPLPFLLPRRCRETCQIMGYDVPKATAVFVNVWAISRDPKYWDDAEMFKPQRFENNSLGSKEQTTSSSRSDPAAACAGVNLGLANIELALASLLYHFDWKLPDGMRPEDIDVWEGEGLIACKKTSLMVHPVTRISPASN